MRDIKGKTVLVTGGASGIGKLLAFGFAERGARVIAWDIDKDAIAALDAEAKERGLPISGMRCNVADRTEVYARAKEVAAKAASSKGDYRDVDILVNNAGIVSGTSLLDTPDEKIERTMAVNAMANFWTVKAFLPGMLERNSGQIVTIASAAGIIGVTGLADYSASKFAAFGFNEALRMELRKKRSRVKTTIVCPFYIDTGLFEGVKTRFPFLLPIMKKEKATRKILKAILKGKKRLVMPFFAYSIWVLRLLPVGFMDAMADFFGVSSSMDAFTGRGEKHGR